MRRCRFIEQRGAFFDLVCDWEEGMSAMVRLVNAVITESPRALVARVAFPVTRIGKRFTYIAKDARLESVCGVILTHKRVRCGGGFG